MPGNDSKADMDATIDLCKRLEAAGCALLTVHGRTRFQNKQTVGSCDWDAIKTIKEALTIPVLANGGTADFADLLAWKRQARRCYEPEALLENPSFYTKSVRRDQDGIRLH